MKRYRSYKEHLIERLKDTEKVLAYLNAASEEYLEPDEPGSGSWGVAKISSKMDVNRESFYRSLSSSGKARFSMLINAIEHVASLLSFILLKIYYE